MSSEIQKLEHEIYQLTTELNKLKASNAGQEVRNYSFQTLNGTVSLLDLFAGRDQLMLIHNMGQGCRYCTLWADGFNGFVPHLESVLSLVLVSKDAPEVQRQFANSRGWRFNLASHGGGEYIRDQTVMEGAENAPGVVLYKLREHKIYRKNASAFGPGDLYCSAWNLLGLAGLDAENWTPQFNYWSRPQKMDDGGQNLVD